MTMPTKIPQQGHLVLQCRLGSQGRPFSVALPLAQSTRWAVLLVIVLCEHVLDDVPAPATYATSTGRAVQAWTAVQEETQQQSRPGEHLSIPSKAIYYRTSIVAYYCGERAKASHPTWHRPDGTVSVPHQVPRTRLQVSSVSEVKTNEPKAGTSGSNGAAEKAPEYYEVLSVCAWCRMPPRLWTLITNIKQACCARAIL